LVWIELLVVLLFLYLGVRLGGAGIGLASGVGLAALVFIFKLEPTSPPIDVMLMILAVVCAASAMQAAGGLDYLVGLAERLLRSNPKQITFLGPIVTYLFTFFAGTGHVAYSVLPVIAEVARETRIRPERPLSISVIASQFAITGGPISAAMVAMLGLTEAMGMTLPKLMLITAPSTFIACMITAFICNHLGKELEDDPEYQRRVAAGLIPPVRPKTAEELAHMEVKPGAKTSVIIFLIAAIAVVVLGAVPSLRPTFTHADGTTTTLQMWHAICIVMLVAATCILWFTKCDVSALVKGSVFQAGANALIAIFGIAWAGDTWFNGNSAVINAQLGGVVQSAPWLLAVVLFFFSVLVNSQAATTRAIMPLGIALGIPVPFLAAMFPAVNGYFFVPNYGPIIAAINFDSTGTTRIGKYVLNHSFMIPGLITVVLSVALGFVMQAIVF